MFETSGAGSGECFGNEVRKNSDWAKEEAERYRVPRLYLVLLSVVKNLPEQVTNNMSQQIVFEFINNFLKIGKEAIIFEN